MAIERNHKALLRALTMVFATAGILPGAVVASLPRRVRSMVFDLLRPIEAATLRLIVMAARDVVVSLRPKSPFPAGGIPRGSGERAPSFPLFDRRKRIGDRKQRYAPGAGPRLSFLDGTDPVVEARPTLSPDDLVNAKQLCRRLLALRNALKDLPRQARRLARLQARRERDDERASRRRSPMRPGRPPGYRARTRRGIAREVAEILSDCDELARRALKPPI